TTKDGQPTGALYGFARMLIRLLEDEKPDYLLVAIDAHSPTFRHDRSKDYKATRSETPDDLKPQTTRLREMLDGLSMPWYEHAGFEADDILGTLASVGEKGNWDVKVVTGDGDALQLATQKVHVMLTRRGVTELDDYDHDAVVKRFGFTPNLLPDYKGLRGDTSDNIPGVPGIGEKTGGKLVGEFGSLEQIYENIEQVKPDRIRNLLIKHREQAFESRLLARIITDLPVDLDPQKCDVQPFDQLSQEKQERFVDTLRLLEFKSLTAQYNAMLSGGALPSEEPLTKPLDVAFERAKDESALQEWLEGHQSKCIAVARVGKAVALARDGKVLLCNDDLTALKSWLEDKRLHKAAHDAKAFIKSFESQNIAVAGMTNDTLLISWLLKPGSSALPFPALCEKYLSLIVEDIAVSAKDKKVKASLFEEDDIEPECDEKVLANYAAAVDLLHPKLREELKEIGEEVLFDEIELPLIDVLLEMERNGMQLDPGALIQCRNDFEKQIDALQKEIWELADEEFNIGSPKQLQVILYEKLQLSPGRNTKTGKSTDATTLESLADDHAIVSKILEYRGLTKLKSTYVDALLSLMDDSTHRIHTELNQTGAVTGRLSSSNPNLQNIPIRSAEGRRIRQAFIAAPERLLLKADYSQIELRILANITRDSSLIEAFKNNEDVHSRTAADIFGVDISEVDADMRRKAKMTNYAIAYGVSGFGLARQLGNTTPKEAQEIIDRYFETLPGVKNYIEETIVEGREKGYVQTLLGRRRPSPDLRSPKGQERAAAERASINHPIQGTAADIIKIAMIALFEELQKERMQSILLMQVHDELIFEVPEEEKTQLAKMLPKFMCDLPSSKINMDVPLVIDIGVGKNWNETEEI
ncbi:MAG: DNA polymerase I, partial [Abditibacteriaceae bacterium]